MRAWFRLFTFAITATLHFGRFAFRALFSNKDRLSLGLEVRRRWLRFIMPIMGIRLEVKGTPPTEPGIVVGNHVSYLDPLALLHDTLALPVAKAEVGKWPLIGPLAGGTGILFVKRSSKESRSNTKEAIANAVKEGRTILNYPEGTTHHEPKTLPFKLGAFSIAAEHGFPIYPTAIWYDREEAAWVGDDTFLPHFLRVFRKKHLTMYFSYGPRLEGKNAEALLEQAQSWIDQELLKMYNV
ncbi:MAG: lysophospholipid acyltransferase family protein [Bacteroidia bacterium]